VQLVGFNKYWIFSCQSRNYYGITSYGEFSVFNRAHRNEQQNMCIVSVAHNLKRAANKVLCEAVHMCTKFIVFQVHYMELFFVQ